MVDPISTAEELYPSTDGMQQVSRTEIPAGYDLSLLLSYTFRNKDWVLAFSDAASNITYTNAAQQRQLLAVSREPENVDRSIKISLAKMLGLDYQSDSFADKDYDRLVNFLGVYNPQKGPDHFVSFMGFLKNSYITLIRLWTKDYQSFLPGIPPGETTIFKGGDWYPTSHVGVAYDPYATDTQLLDAPHLKDLFYQMAPINLVLLWVGEVLRGDPMGLHFGLASVAYTKLLGKISQPKTIYGYYGTASFFRNYLFGTISYPASQATNYNFQPCIPPILFGIQNPSMVTEDGTNVITDTNQNIEFGL